MPNIVFYRNKCIGCGFCCELMPVIWRMSKKDGKATLLNSVSKKDVYILPIDHLLVDITKTVSQACPVKIIKLNEF